MCELRGAGKRREFSLFFNRTLSFSLSPSLLAKLFGDIRHFNDGFIVDGNVFGICFSRCLVNLTHIFALRHHFADRGNYGVLYCGILHCYICIESNLRDINIFSTKIKRILVNKICLFVEFNICIILYLYIRYIFYVYNVYIIFNSRLNAIV